MALFEWDKKYSVDVERFDKQHKKMINILNDLHQAMKEGKSKENMGVILKRLEDYTEYHFGDEEKYMKKYGYNNFKEHKDRHDKFVNEIKEYKEKYEKGEMTVSMDMMNFLKDWLSNHINGMDKKYSEFFEDKDIG